ncbi:MBL fold metallo-hydrolase [Leifsonia poae]|uniref:MBL fold metallo-hydrolase n=1 Tax=Leifsonia poae TaxID=110933 RepID=UPI003D66EC0C
MRVTTLGSSTHYPRPGNACSGYLVQSGDTSIWVDAGAGTLAELQRHVQLEDIDAIWISHTHADHTSDLLTAYYAYRFGDVLPGAPIPLFAPHGLRERMVAFLGGSAETGLDLVFGFADLGATPGGGSAQVGDLTLSWREVDHDVPGYALRVDTADDGSFAFSGDTGPCEALDELASGCDALLCEAGIDAQERGEHPVHQTPEEAGATATRAGVGRLIVTHTALGLSGEAAAARAQQHYDGPVELARPGSVFVVEPSGQLNAGTDSTGT